MDVFDLFAKISLDTSEYEQAVKGASADGQQLAKSWSGFGQKISAAFSVLGKAAVAGAGAATAAVGVLTKSSLDAYSSFEQLTGGVETLFKTSADTVMEYADNAYKTAGMSANQYMETVTGFSATLLQGLAGDTEAAAEYADLAITDMADNANKMGTAMQSIQYAYQGFAKDNYTMLDNLKLGYGGTQAEMARLINDSGVLGDAIQVTADTVAQVPFDKIIEAIHVIQTQLGITGTTAAEAATTIEGSVNSMKAAWENLLTGIADENADLGQLTDAFLSSAATAADNILPRIEQILQGMGTALESVAPAIAGQIPQIVSRVAPSMVSAGIQLFSSLVQGLVSAAPQLANAVPDIVQSVAGSFEQSASSMAAAGSSLLAMLQQGITEGIPMLANTAVSIMGEFGNYLQNNLSGLLDAGLSAVSSLSETIRQNAGLLVDGALGLAESLAQGLADSIPTIIENVPEIVTNIAGVINDNAPKVLVSAAKIIATLAEGLIDSIPTLIANIPEIITAIVDAFLAFNWLNLGKSIIELLGNGIKAMSGAVTGFMQSSLKGALDYLKALPKQALQWGKDLIAGFINGMTSSVGGLLKSASQIAGSITNAVCNVLGIHSPSTVFEEIGQYMMDGLEIGLKDGSGDVMKTVDDIAAELESRFSYVMDALGNQQDVVQLKYDVWDSMFGGTSSEAERLAKQLENLTSKQDVQKTKVDAAKTAYDKIVSVYGAASAEATEYEKTLLQETLAYQDLQNEIDDTTDALEDSQNALKKFKQDAETAFDATKNFASSLSSLGNALSNVQDAFKNDSVKLTAQETETLNNKLDVLTAQYNYAQSEVDRLTEAFNASVEQTGVTSEQTIALADELDNAQSEANSLKNEIDSLSETLNGSRPSFGNFVSSIGSSINSVLNLIGSIGDLIQTVGALGKALGAFGSGGGILSSLGSLFGGGGAAAAGGLSLGSLGAIGAALGLAGVTLKGSFENLGKIPGLWGDSSKSLLEKIGGTFWNLTPFSGLVSGFQSLFGGKKDTGTSSGTTSGGIISGSIGDYVAPSTSPSYSTSGNTTIERVDIYIDGAQYPDPESLAEAISIQLQNLTERRVSVFA